MDFLITPLGETPAALLRAKFDEFAQKYKEEVALQQIPWDAYWRELVNVSVHKLGADVAEIGSTWVEPLTAMNVLAPFSRQDINLIGGEQSFFPASWQSVTHVGSQESLGIPARIDMRMIFYWEDMFQAAGVDSRQVFSSPEAMKDGFEKLQHSVPYPWGVITNKLSHDLVYNVASWVWAEGGDFVSKDGTKLLISTDEFRCGLRNYYDLFKFMPPECRDSTNVAVLQLFAERKIAATIQGPWLISYLRNAGLTPTILDLMNVASPPGPPFIGGTVFVRWRHSRKADLAWKLIRALSEKEFNVAFAESSGVLPSHQDAWSDEFLCRNKYNPEYFRGLQNGRCLPPVRLWGMIEDRLTQMLGNICDDLYTVNEEARSGSVDQIVTRYLEPLARRFETILSDYHRPPSWED
jgi:multiple sugar transport system substrate-binding protein